MTTIQRIKCKTDNCYLVARGRKAILVDTASGLGYDSVMEACGGYDMQHGTNSETSRLPGE